MMAVAAIKLLVRFDFPSETVRLWAGSGAYIDANGDHWRGAGELPESALSQLEFAFAGEAANLDLSLSGIPQDIADLAYQETQSDDVIGAVVQILIQDCDANHQPDGSDPSVKYTGRIVDIRFDDTVVTGAGGDENLFQVTITLVNRFNLRRLTSGSVLSDADQKSRSAVLNPAANEDRFCERLPLLADQTLNWPRF